MAKNKRGRETTTAVVPTVVPQESSVHNGMTEAVQGAVIGSRGGFLASMVNQTDTVLENLRMNLITLNRNALSYSYAEKGLVKTVVDLPVEDALRGGITISTKQLDAEEIEEITSAMENEGDLEALGYAQKWRRLYGGGALIIVTDQDPSTPFVEESISKGDKLSFLDADCWELQPASGTVTGVGGVQTTPEHYSYYNMRIHKSRVLRFSGIRAPSDVRPMLRGWGLSCVEDLVDSINQFLKSRSLTFEVLDEFKLDIFRIKGLTNSLLQKDGTEKIKRRIQTANQEKNFLNALTMDSEDAYEQKQLSFGGIADMQKEFRMDIASATRFPITKLFGISASGFNSGEDDIENYNAMVESQVRSKLKPGANLIVRLRSRVLFGHAPSDLKTSFEPLRMLSAEQNESVKTAKAGRLDRAYEKGAISIGQYQEALNKDQLLPIQVDVTNQADEREDDEQENDDAQEKD
jgi:uncharacterized protein